MAYAKNFKKAITMEQAMDLQQLKVIKNEESLKNKYLIPFYCKECDKWIEETFDANKKESIDFPLEYGKCPDCGSYEPKEVSLYCSKCKTEYKSTKTGKCHSCGKMLFKKISYKVVDRRNIRRTILIKTAIYLGAFIVAGLVAGLGEATKSETLMNIAAGLAVIITISGAWGIYQAAATLGDNNTYHLSRKRYQELIKLDKKERSVFLQGIA